jgi:phospholipase C
MKPILLWLVFLGATLVQAQKNTPFQHVILLIQENRTVDNLFGSDALNQPRLLPDADLAQQGSCHGEIITLGNQGNIDACFDPHHNHPAFESAFDKGALDGFCDNRISVHCTLPPNPQYQYVPNTPQTNGFGIIDPYLQIAENYGFANYMFQTNQGNSFAAHQFLFSGTTAPVPYPDQYYDWLGMENPEWVTTKQLSGCLGQAGLVVQEFAPDGTQSNGYNNGFPCYDHNTLADLLDSNMVNGKPEPISWRYYGPEITTNMFTPPNAIRHLCQPSQPTSGVCTGMEYKHNVIKGAESILTHLGANPNNPQCSLPHMSWVSADGNWSDHPGTTGTDGGPSWIAAVVNAVGGYDNSGNRLPTQCNYWNNTVILVVWDDWGGWYDHVMPYNCSSSGVCAGYPNGTAWMFVYGFRVPFLVVSAYTPAGYVSGSPKQGGEVLPYIHDFGSILNFIEHAFGHGGSSIGTIGDLNYPYADYFAPDSPTSGCPPSTCPYSLSDFFNFANPRPFMPITGAKYADDYFINAAKHLSNFPMDPDNDANDETQFDVPQKADSELR